MRIFELDILGITIAPSYYWLMYALSFIVCFFLLKKDKYFSDKQLDSLMIYMFLGVVLGWRLGYVFIYNLPYFLENVGEIFQPWKWGMSFHGGLIWVLIAMYLFARKHKAWFVQIAEQIVWVVPVWLFFWRLGNYVNKELLGLPWYDWLLAVSSGWILYFPTPLLEAMLEGLILFLILVYARKRIARPGILWSLFLLLYGVFRFFVEFFRIPDVQIGYLAFGWFTMGHLLSTIMIFVWVSLLIAFSGKKST